MSLLTFHKQLELHICNYIQKTQPETTSGLTKILYIAVNSQSDIIANITAA